ncbi:MAG: M23 family metallopeptidase, partial [Hyphomicrobiaceae bacterium]|nr:M23 family metallopeptidase [Hyphomicrobiaceae bacterium]
MGGSVLNVIRLFATGLSVLTLVTAVPGTSAMALDFSRPALLGAALQSPHGKAHPDAGSNFEVGGRCASKPSADRAGVAARGLVHPIRCDVPPGGLPSIVPLPIAEPAPAPQPTDTAEPVPPQPVPAPAPTAPGQQPQTPSPTPVVDPAPAPKPPAITDMGFRYYPPGDLVPQDSGRGRKDRKVWLPDMIYPLKLAGSEHAYMNSQIWGYGGGGWGGKGAAGGGECDPRNYDPTKQRDNYCEVRSHGMPLCPAGKGHQGQDIRPSTCVDNKWEAVAVVDGVIDLVTSNTTVRLKANDGTQYRYLHMHPASITVKVGQKVKQGQTLGRVSRYMNGSIQTTRHLHFDVLQTVRTSAGKTMTVFVPTWTSLIASYRKAKGLDAGIDADGNLIADPAYEIGAVAPKPPEPLPTPPEPPKPAEPAPAPAPAEPPKPAEPAPAPAPAEPPKPAEPAPAPAPAEPP